MTYWPWLCNGILQPSVVSTEEQDPTTELLSTTKTGSTAGIVSTSETVPTVIAAPTNLGWKRSTFQRSSRRSESQSNVPRSAFKACALLIHTSNHSNLKPLVKRISYSNEQTISDLSSTSQSVLSNPLQTSSTSKTHSRQASLSFLPRIQPRNYSQTLG